MKGLIDTNLLIYATSESSPQYQKARAFLNHALMGPECYACTWVNFAEYLSFTTQSFSGLPPLLMLPQALENLQELLSSPFLRVISEGDAHWETLTDILSKAGSVRGAFIHDCRIAAIMRENGLKTIFTHDADFRKIPGLDVIDPL